MKVVDCFKGFNRMSPPVFSKGLTQFPHQVSSRSSFFFKLTAFL
jgi:hypothetical protein